MGRLRAQVYGLRTLPRNQPGSTNRRAADYAAVLAAINAELISEKSRLPSGDHTVQLNKLGDQVSDTNARVRSLEDGQAEIKDLLIRALDRSD